MYTGYSHPSGLYFTSAQPPEGLAAILEGSISMAKVKFKPGIEQFQGTFYDVVFKLSPQGKPIVTKRPDMTGVQWSEAQKKQRQRFQQANEYAKAAMADPDVRAVYETMALRTNRHPYRLAFSDYCNGNNLLSKE